MPEAYNAAAQTARLERELARVEASGRWSPGRKEILLTLIRRGATTVEQACAKYGLTAEEIDGWQKRFDAHGQPGLAIYKTQQVGR